MKVIATELPEVLIIEPVVIRDARGFFLETWNERAFRDATRLDVHFVQDNLSRSLRDVLRGIHYQVIEPQGKLVRASRGVVLDVAVDLRRSSRHFGRSVGVELSDENHRQMWLPAGFGHAFLVRSEAAEVCYKTTAYWFKEHERAIRWDDPTLRIDWGLAGRPPVLAAKDAAASALDGAEMFA